MSVTSSLTTTPVESLSDTKVVDINSLSPRKYGNDLRLLIFILISGPRCIRKRLRVTTVSPSQDRDRKQMRSLCLTWYWLKKSIRSSAAWPRTIRTTQIQVQHWDVISIIIPYSSWHLKSRNCMILLDLIYFTCDRELPSSSAETLEEFLSCTKVAGINALASVDAAVILD